MASVAIYITSDVWSSVAEDLFLPDGRGLSLDNRIVGIVLAIRMQKMVAVI
jgi:hypothetical protein